MKNNRLLSMLCAICMVMALSIPVFATDVAEAYTSDTENEFIAPRAEPHCQIGNQVGVILITGPTKKNVGNEIRNCTHGVVGAKDVRYQYQDTTQYSCTLCSYSATVVSTPYWGSWSCRK